MSDADPTPGDAPGPEPARQHITDRTVTEVVERTRDVIRKTREMLESSRELLDRVRHRDGSGAPDAESENDANKPGPPTDPAG
ncbi:MAG TPA: hypothetical protein VHG08_06135 [Longimicrobium sp.]|nr:hypothetical protein [Longimicrobium sp.]